MQKVVIDEPYKFVPPVYSEWWPTHPAPVSAPLPAQGVRRALGRMPARRAAPRVARARAQHHARAESLPAWPTRWCWASWPGGRLPSVRDGQLACVQAEPVQTFMIRRMGAFSVFREGNDRQAIDTAIDILVDRQRPLIMFPEGAITRHNDLIEEMMDGPSFIARQAAKRLKKQGSSRRGRDPPGGDPLCVSRRPRSDARSRCWKSSEQRFSWQPQKDLSIVDRIDKIGHALLVAQGNRVSRRAAQRQSVRAGGKPGRGAAGEAGGPLEDQRHARAA